jgi:predicted lipoprotein
MMRPLLPLLAGVVLLSACGDVGDGGPRATEPDDDAATVDDLIEGIAEKQIVEDISRFRGDTTGLVTSAEAFCDSPAAGRLSRTEDAWLRTARQWYRAQLWNFGPADADPVFPLYTFIDSLRLRGTDYSDSVSATLTRWRDAEDALDAAFFAEQRFDDVGLLAVERALFESEDVLADFEANPRNCDILLGLANTLLDRATELERGWTEDYADTGTPFLELLLADELPDGREPLVQIVISAQQYLDYLHARGVVALAGKTSGTGWLLVESALDAVEDLLTKNHGGESLFFWMDLLGHPDAVDKVAADLETAREALAAQDRVAFEAAVAVLDGDFKREVPDSLGIELGLTFTDGD